MFNNIYEYIINIVSVLLTLITAYILYLKSKKTYDFKVIEENNRIKRENEDFRIKFSIYGKLADLMAVNDIKTSVVEIFEKTKSDRFLILVAINGKTEFRMLSVIYEQEKSFDGIIATYRYKNVNTDTAYRKMLKSVETLGELYIETDKMDDQILKTFNQDEGIKFSIFRCIMRGKVDKDNDFLIYSSIGTKGDSNFTEEEKNIISSRYNSTIGPKVKQLLSGENKIKKWKL